MNAAYSKHFEAVSLCCHVKAPNMSLEAPAKYLKKSKSFVKQWVRHHSIHKNVDDLSNRGKIRKTTSREDNVIGNLFNQNPSLTLDKAQKKLSKKGIKYLKSLLETAFVKKRMEWAQENLNRDWDNVIFTDEASFWLSTSTKRVWCVKGKKLIQRTVKHPRKIHVWGCFNRRGFGKLLIVKQNLDTRFMKEIYQCALIPSADKWLGKGNRDWLLQEDNDPKYRSRLCSMWKEENDVQTLGWPSQSPDANPTENVWALMKMKLQGVIIKNQIHLARKIREIWRTLPVQYAEKLVESIPRRCQAILSNNGDWISY
ncbi:hypothetical protein ILUMI_27285 [Ignelater luminosus]|uniref:Tc1-like transposase DDE domain-containing protein n=1 Tax=Ignelater luminosus TaxID=2038154 RepID=A0A8K0C4Q7_IGNLU|nr:hypothetical protein ILUMI_27285 [Ignelater luminosus]